MKTTSTLIAATLALPLLLLGCDRSEQSPSAAAPSEDKQASSPDRMLERSPPAAGQPSDSSSMSSSPSDATGSPGAAPSSPSPDSSKPDEPRKAY